MKLTGSIVILLACAGICATAQAQPKEPTIATMNCVGNVSTQFDLVGYQVPIFSAPSTIGSQSSGAGAGKVTFTPVVVDLVVGSRFPQLVQLIDSANQFSKCVIRFGHSGLEVTMALVTTKSITLVPDDSDTTAHDSEGIRGTGTPVIAQMTLEVGAFQVRD